MYTQDKFKVDITDANLKELEVQFSYSVEYFESKTSWQNRFKKYTHSKFYPQKIKVCDVYFLF